MKTLSSYNFRDKRVLLRTDLNSDVVNKKVLMSERIKRASETISELKKKKAKVVIIAHQGRPKDRYFTSLKQHSRLLSKFTKVKFVNDIIGKKALKEIKNLKPGQALLLENIRFLKDEFNFNGKQNRLIKNLVPLFDIYVNDAFSVCHRKHTSIVGFPKYLMNCAGRLLEKEVKSLKKINLKNCLYVLGGAKPEENMKLLKGKKSLACGLFGQLCLISKGKNLGAQNKYLKDKLYLISKLKKRLKGVQTPVDFAVKIRSRRKELSLEEFPSKYEIYDIGEKTMKNFIEEIQKANSIYMKGPVGFCADGKFCNGTFTILKAIAKNKGHSIIGGGHLSDAVKKSRIKLGKFDNVSLSGGALLRYIAGEKLPGLEALR
ncbi:bifunctional PGK/TIM [archaeon BMS3Abin17]|nr:bifunctional PGK/TIM [archaeon BMS3Abin17]HDZ60949.1 phosphoglycerate kinase [Candidatus Pacearchaeota archaeon]